LKKLVSKGIVGYLEPQIAKLARELRIPEDFVAMPTTRVELLRKEDLEMPPPAAVRPESPRTEPSPTTIQDQVDMVNHELDHLKIDESAVAAEPVVEPVTQVDMPTEQPTEVPEPTQVPTTPPTTTTTTNDVDAAAADAEEEEVPDFT